jgi:hypothetical protein
MNSKEDAEMRKNRIAAVWDSDCSFEADYDWLANVKAIYHLERGYILIYIIQIVL